MWKDTWWLTLQSIRLNKFAFITNWVFFFLIIGTNLASDGLDMEDPLLNKQVLSFFNHFSCGLLHLPRW